MRIPASRLPWALAMAGCLLGMPVTLMAAEDAARVEAIRGTVNAIADGQPPRRLARDSGLVAGERIEVGDNASVTLRFRDQSRFDLGPRGVMVVDQYLEAANPEDSSFAARILKGSFRFITGLIARKRPASMRVGMTVATIGVRGTHVAGEVDDTSARVVLLEPDDDAARATAIEVSNAFGSVVVDRPGYGTEIPDAHSPPSPVRRMQVRQVEDLLRAVRNGMRMQPPRPR